MIDLTINGINATQRYGLTLDETSLSALMTPAPNKADVTNKSRLEHGTRVVSGVPVMKDERELTIKVAICAESRAEFFEKYNMLCTEVFDGGNMVLTTEYQPTVRYKCRYRKCTQMTYYNGKIGTFSLSITEPNPADRL